MGLETLSREQLASIVKTAPDPFAARVVLQQTSSPNALRCYLGSHLSDRRVKAIRYLLDADVVQRTGMDGLTHSEKGRELYANPALWRAIPEDFTTYLSLSQLCAVAEDKLREDLIWECSYDLIIDQQTAALVKNAQEAAKLVMVGSLASRAGIPSAYWGDVDLDLKVTVPEIPRLRLTDVLLDDLPTPPSKIGASIRFPPMGLLTYLMVEANQLSPNGDIYRVRVLDRIDYDSPDERAREKEDEVLPKVYNRIKYEKPVK